jgi:alkaline phosphatase D
MSHTDKPATASSSRSIARIRPADKAKFPAGVMAGDARPRRVVLWTKYTGHNRRLTVRLQSRGRRGILRTRDVPATVRKGGFVHVDVPNLRPRTLYKYVFLERSSAGVVRSPVGYFRTAIPVRGPHALDTVVFGGTSCTFARGSRRTRATNRLLRHAARKRARLSFFLHAGDQVYCDKPRKVKDIQGYRDRYERAFSAQGLAALHAAFGMYTTWDDHEVVDDWGRYDLRSMSPRRRAELKQQIRVGKQSFFDHQPIQRRSRSARKLYRKFQWGRTLELFVLDGRSERRVAQGKYISDDQMKWLVDGLQNSTAKFKFILNSCPIGLFTLAIDEWRQTDDRWAAFPGQRDPILEVAQRVGGVWWLSGDFHFGTVGRVEAMRYPQVREVLMGSSGSGLGGDNRRMDVDLLNPPSPNDKDTQWQFATHEHNYVEIKADPRRERLDIYFYGGSRLLRHVTYSLR